MGEGGAGAAVAVGSAAVLGGAAAVAGAGTGAGAGGRTGGVACASCDGGWTGLDNRGLGVDAAGAVGSPDTLRIAAVDADAPPTALDPDAAAPDAPLPLATADDDNGLAACAAFALLLLMSRSK